MFCSDCGTLIDYKNVAPGIGVICKNCGNDGFVGIDVWQKLKTYCLKWVHKHPEEAGWYWVSLFSEGEWKSPTIIHYSQEDCKKDLYISDIKFAGPIAVPTGLKKDAKY
jgi:hypothetical protein